MHQSIPPPCRLRSLSPRALAQETGAICSWLLLLSFLTPLPAQTEDPTQPRIWTSNRGERIHGHLVEFNYRTATIDLGARTFRIPLERLSRQDRQLLLELPTVGPESRFKPGDPWLEDVQPPPDASGRAPAPVNSQGITLPIRLMPLEQRQWTLRDHHSRRSGGTSGTRGIGPSFRGRLVGARENLLLIETQGEVRAIIPHDLQFSDSAYLRQWANMGLLERDDPEGPMGDKLRRLGFNGWRIWRSGRNDLEPFRNSIPYQLYVPELQPQQSYPLVVVLHGRGEGGQDNYQQFRHPDPFMFVEPDLQREHPCFVMVPQHSENWSWVSSTFTEALYHQELVVKAIRRMLTVDYIDRIDPDRIYLVGLWSGGHGAAQLCALFPETFAACVATSSRPFIEWFEHAPIAPMWFFVHDQDHPLILDSLERFRREMPRHMPQPIVTIFSGDRHEGRRAALRDSGMFDWLFSQRLTRPSANPADGWPP